MAIWINCLLNEKDAEVVGITMIVEILSAYTPRSTSYPIVLPAGSGKE
jgi:hypothetical protein